MSRRRRSANARILESLGSGRRMKDTRYCADAAPWARVCSAYSRQIRSTSQLLPYNHGFHEDLCFGRQIPDLNLKVFGMIPTHMFWYPYPGLTRPNPGFGIPNLGLQIIAPTTDDLGIIPQKTNHIHISDLTSKSQNYNRQNINDFRVIRKFFNFLCLGDASPQPCASMAVLLSRRSVTSFNSSGCSPNAACRASIAAGTLASASAHAFASPRLFIIHGPPLAYYLELSR